MGTDAAATDDYYEGGAEFLETRVGEEDAVARELFEDEFWGFVSLYLCSLWGSKSRSVKEQNVPSS